MPKFKVYAPLVATKYLGEFEGRDSEDAILKAVSAARPVGLCHQCSNAVGDSYLEIDDSKAVAEKTDG